ncbi:MAG: VCBS repeat-containing protein [Caldilineaceae bacterium]|nr:VCBS repeat-containing protein [Caldilineaceae bacterium]
MMLFLPSPAAAQGVGIPLGPPQVLATGIDGAHSVYAGDMDGDGDLDVVVASRMDGRIRLLRNDGAPAPGFSVRTVAELPGAYMAIPVDINQDGHLDIAAVAVETVQPSAQPNGADAPAANGSVVWLENNGASTPEFAPHRIADGLDYPVSIFAGDMDNDGDVDLLSASRNDNQVRWYRNDGATNPGFSAITINDGALGAVSVHAGDLDGDGNLDIVSASEDDDQIAWYRNDGSDSPVFSRQIIRSAGGVTPVGIDLAKSVFVADLDGDGDQDIAYASENANEIGWYENDGAPMPGFLQHVVATNLDHIKQVYAADLDLDGDNDLFSASSGDGRIAWYENDGSDDPLFTQHIVVEGAAGARGVSVADLDQDGDPDILAAARDANEVYWFENQTIHRNARYTPLPNMFLAPQTAPRHAIGSDIDGDGDTDILSIGHSALIWHENDGGRPPAFTPHVIDSEIAGGRWVEAGDLDNDGDPDIVAASLNNQLLRWYINQGNGQFTPRTVARDFIFPRAVIAADLNNNHDLDLVAASDENNAIFWFANDGGDVPRFATYLITDQAGYARSVFVADVNGDGDPDVLSAAQQMGEIAWYENNGAYWPDFRRHVIVSGREDEKLPDGAGGVWWPNGAQHVHAADLDADGDMDVLSVSEHDSTIAWYENDGNDPPSFTLHFISRTARGVHAVYTGDADQDGDIDVMAAIEYDHEIAWYENDGRRDAPPQFVYHKIYDQALTAHSVHANDVDGDGDLDVIATARSNDNVLWFENLGGQYRIQLMDQLTGSLIGGQSNSLMRVRVLHRGRRPLDASFYLGKLSVIFQDGRSSPMTADQLRAVLPRLAVYQDSDGNGQFDADRDALITQTADYALEDDGLLTLNFPRTNPDIQIEPGTFKDYFLVGDVSGACGDATPRIQVTLVTNSGVFSAQDDRPLLPEFSRSITGEDTPYEQEPLALQINEFMADNVSVLPDPDEPGEFPDWIELYNRSAFPMDIGGLYLSDDPGQPTRYRIPDGVTVPGRGYIVFIADGEFTQGPLHTNFRLAKGGESVALFDRDAMNNQLIDIHTYGAVEADQSIGRLHDNAEEWEILPVPSPGSMNVDAPLDRQFFLPAIRLEIGC